MRVEAEYDDLLVLAPSFVAYRDGLLEGKSIGTAKEIDLLFLNMDRTIKARMDPEGFARERKVGVTVAARALRDIKERVERELLRLVLKHAHGNSELMDFRGRVVKLMKTAWRDVFHAGVRSTGIKGIGSGGRGPLVQLDPEDEAWLRSAMTHEMGFLNKFIAAVHGGTWKMPLPQRVLMYVNTLTSFFDSARVIGLPATVILHWVGPNDERSCEGCRYLFAHSPYTKKVLPTVPRASLTPCLTNCRDRLLIRQATPEAVVRITNASKYTRSGHVKNLRRIKARHG